MSDSDTAQLDSSIMTWQEFLIELIRMRPCLYDKYDPDFSDTRGVKTTAWDDISKELIGAGYTELNGKITGVY